MLSRRICKEYLLNIGAEPKKNQIITVFIEFIEANDRDYSMWTKRQRRCMNDRLYQPRH